MLRVFLLCEFGPAGRYHPSAYIRLLRPLRHPSLADALEVEDGRFLGGGDYDCVILERYWRFDVTLARAEEVVRDIRRRAPRFLYQIDDNLLDVAGETPGPDPVSEERRAAVRYFLRSADGVIVSTPALARRLAGLNQRIVVVPNQLDEQLFPDLGPRLAERRRAAGPVILGYMGTGTHARDLMMVLEPLRAVLASHRGAVELELAGVTKDERVHAALAGLPVRLLSLPTTDLYLDYVAWATENIRWDAAIAPLEDTALNRCKSDIKFLDYALLGVPGVFSLAEPYQGSVVDGENGLLCRRDAEDWREALERMVGDAALRSRLALRAHAAARPERTLALRSGDWRNAIEELCRA